MVDANVQLDAITGLSDPTQLQALDDALSRMSPSKCGHAEFFALLRVFERFPDHDGFGVFWSINHFLEACRNYESGLVASVRRTPCEFNLTMINRLLNGNITHVEGQSLMALLADVASGPTSSKRAQELANHFLHYQNNKASTQNPDH